RSSSRPSSRPRAAAFCRGCCFSSSPWRREPPGTSTGRTTWRRSETEGHRPLDPARREVTEEGDLVAGEPGVDVLAQLIAGQRQAQMTGGRREGDDVERLGAETIDHRADEGLGLAAKVEVGLEAGIAALGL